MRPLNPDTPPPNATWLPSRHQRMMLARWRGGECSSPSSLCSDSKWVSSFELIWLAFLGDCWSSRFLPSLWNHFAAFERSSMPWTSQQMKWKVISALDSLQWSASHVLLKAPFKYFSLWLISHVFLESIDTPRPPQASNLPPVTGAIYNADHGPCWCCSLLQEKEFYLIKNN